MKWTLSPIIITLNSKSTSIKDVPFPGKKYFSHSYQLFSKKNCSLYFSFNLLHKAVTVCNMNQVRNSAIQNISKDSAEFDAIRGLCRQEFYWENEKPAKARTWDLFRKVLLKVNLNKANCRSPSKA